MDLYVTESGLFGAPMVLFLHGSPLSGRMWQPQLNSMKDFHCVAPDLPGHGKSSGIKKYSKQEVVDALINLIRQTSPNGKTHLVGYSLGGVIAQSLMAAVPDLIDRVVLCGHCTPLNKLWILGHVLNLPFMNLLKPEQIGWIVSSQFGIPADLRDNYKNDFRMYSLDSYMKVLWTYGDMRIPTTNDSSTLLLVGEKEGIFSKKAVQALSHRIPHARGVCLSGCRAGWNLRDPELMTRIIRAWLTNHLLPAGLEPLL